MSVDKKLNEVLENLRQQYQLASLDIEDCHQDPIEQFDQWLAHAISAHVDEPNAFTLSTVEASRPRARVVLLKGVQDKGFVFYTNYLSSKGHEVEKNPLAAMTFLWLPLQRQVRIEGTLKKVSAECSDEYFHKRPRGSQLGAIASPQSQKISSRAELEKLFKEAEEKLGKSEVLPRPPHWGGYVLEPNYFEFWQGRNNRMHDRICYEQTTQGWIKSRLAP